MISAVVYATLDPFTIIVHILIAVGVTIYTLSLHDALPIQSVQPPGIPLTQVGNALLPFDLRICPKEPVPAFCNALVDGVRPVRTPYAVVDATPVPPYATVRPLPFHVPHVIVTPTTVNLWTR